MRQLPVWWGCVALVAGCAGGGGAKDAAGLPDVVETQAELAEPDAAEAVPEVDVCLPQCAGKVCGEDGCGGQCGTCAGKQDVCANGLCVCQPDCTGKACGDDGCGGSCGTCLGEQMACVEGACVCQPECAGKE